MALKMVWLLDTNNERMALNPTEQTTNLQKLDDIKISEGYFLHLFESMP